GSQPVNTVKEFRCADRGDRDLFVSGVRIPFKPGVEVEFPAFGGDQHAGVDQRSHRSPGTAGVLAALIMRSTSSRYRLSSGSRSAYQSARSRNVQRTTSTGSTRTTGTPPRSTT